MANTANVASDGQVTLEEAKEIALNHAGLTADGVTFIKGKLERDERREKYDIEFYTSVSKNMTTKSILKQEKSFLMTMTQKIMHLKIICRKQQ